MFRCKDCNGLAHDDDSYCRFCGVEHPDREVIVCDCNAEVFLEDNFCHSCGVAFEGLEESEDVIVEEDEDSDSDDEDGADGQDTTSGSEQAAPAQQNQFF